MKKILIGLFVIAVFAGTGCETNPDCEYDNTGTLKVKNKHSAKSEVMFDGTKLFNLEPGETKEETVSSGTYDLRCFTTGESPQELERSITINDCETTEFFIVY